MVNNHAYMQERIMKSGICVCKAGATHSVYGAGGTPGSRELWRGGVVCRVGPRGGPGTLGRRYQKHTWKH